MKKVYCFILLYILILICSCSKIVLYDQIDITNRFDTDGYIIIEYYNQKEYQKIEELKIKVDNLLEKLEKEFAGSDSDIDSTTKKINENSGKNIYTEVSDDFIYVLNKGIYYNKISNEYDLTIGSLSKLWNISNQAEYCMINNSCTIPTDEEIKYKKELVDSSYISIKDNTISLTKEGMMLDFGSIGKGYAIDKISELIQNELNEERFFIINFGGSVHINGNRTHYESKYGRLNIIYNDSNDIVEELMYIYPTKSNIVSSGATERYIVYNDVKYSHILSPKTGYPVENNITIVSIFGDTNIDSDALSTIFYMEGIDFIDVLKQLEVDYLLIDKDKNIYISENLEIELLNNNYKIIKE